MKCGLLRWLKYVLSLQKFEMNYVWYLEKQVLLELVHILINEKWFILKIPILRAPISICGNKTDRNKSITTSASLKQIEGASKGEVKYSSKSPSAHLCYEFLPSMFFCFELLLLRGPTFFLLFHYLSQF